MMMQYEADKDAAESVTRREEKWVGSSRLTPLSDQMQAIN